MSDGVFPGTVIIENKLVISNEILPLTIIWSKQPKSYLKSKLNVLLFQPNTILVRKMQQMQQKTTNLFLQERGRRYLNSIYWGFSQGYRH